MNHFLRRVAALAAVGVAVASLAAANVPLPELSNVPNCVSFSPTAVLQYKVTIVGLSGPLNAS